MRILLVLLALVFAGCGESSDDSKLDRIADEMEDVAREMEDVADTGGLGKLTYLRDLNDWVVKRQLQTVPGVTDILSSGGHVLQYQIELYPYLLHQYDLAIEDVVTALGFDNRQLKRALGES